MSAKFLRAALSLAAVASLLAEGGVQAQPMATLSSPAGTESFYCNVVYGTELCSLNTLRSFALTNGGNQTVGLGLNSTTSPAAWFRGGSLMTTPQAGAFENDGTNLFYTQSSAARRTLLFADFSNVTGTLDVPHGGTGRTSLTTHGVLVGEGTGAVQPLAAGSFNQLLFGTNGDPAFATLSGDCAMDGVTPGKINCGLTGPVARRDTNNVFTQPQTFAAATSAGPSFYCPEGSTPTAPANGSFWCTPAGVFAQIEGGTLQLGAVGAPGVSTFNGRGGTVNFQLSDIPTGTFPNGVGAVTQPAGDNSMNLATTAYVDRNRARYSAASIGVLTTNTAAQNTTAINAALSTFTAGSGAEIDFPCGTFPFQNITIPQGLGPIKLAGAGRGCTFLQQDAADLANNFVIINPTGVLNGVQWTKIEDLTLTATAQKTAAAMIYGKGVAMPTFTDLIILNAYNGIVLDGIDRNIFSDIQIWNPANDGYQLYDGLDCGFTPVTTTATGAVPNGSSSFNVTSAAGISPGMSINDASIGGNSTLGTVQTIVGTLVTLNSPTTEVSDAGHNLVFGGECGGTAILWAKDNWVANAGRFGVYLQGGVGGVISQGLEILGSGAAGFTVDTSGSHGVSNRELFFTSADTAFDSNVGPDLNINANSIAKLVIDGAWFNASSGSPAISVALQRPQVNPIETGAIVRITGSTVGQSNGAGLYYVDQGTLTLVGNDFSYVYGGGGSADGINIQTNTGVGTVLISGNTFHNNGNYAVRVFGTQPPYLNISNNMMTGNGSGSVFGITPGANAVCSGNIGPGTTAAGC